MKTKKLVVYACTIVICILLTNHTTAQQAKLRVMPQNPQEIHEMAAGGQFTTKIFMAPNKTYGYDILSNGKLIYHQPAFSRVPAEGDVMLTKKEQADLAAMVAIEKIKRGKNPELSNEELQKIIAH